MANKEVQEPPSIIDIKLDFLFAYLPATSVYSLKVKTLSLISEMICYCGDTGRKKSPGLIILQIPESAIVAGKLCHRANTQMLLSLLKGLNDLQGNVENEKKGISELFSRRFQEGSHLKTVCYLHSFLGNSVEFQ